MTSWFEGPAAARVVLPLALLLSGAAGATVVTDWNNATLDEIRASRPSPPVASRALAVAHTCMYEAWTAYDPRAIGSVVGASLRRPAAEASEATKAKAISYAAYRCLQNLFPAGASRLEVNARGARRPGPANTANGADRHG